MVDMRLLNNGDVKALAKFFKGLSDDTLYFMNRYGLKIENPDELAEKQVNLPVENEAGFIVENEKEILGYSWLSFFPGNEKKKHVCSLGIVVSDKYQGKGYSKLLMDYMIEYAKGIGMKKIWLSVYPDNEIAFRLYKKSYGFEIEGVFMYEERINGKMENVISMALFLDDKLKNTKKERRDLIAKLEVL